MAAVTPATIDNAVIDALVDGTHAQPHEVLGPHIADGTVTVRVLRPNATSVDLMLGGERISETTLGNLLQLEKGETCPNALA